MNSTQPETEDSEDGTRRSIGARRNPASQEAILDAAEAVLREGGIAGFSIEAVARRARAGKPTIYRWWPHRTALMLDVYRRFKNTKGFPDTGTLRGDLVSLLDNHLLGFWNNSLCGTVYRAIVAEAQTDREAAKVLIAYQADRKAYSARIVERAKARGEVPEDTNSALVIDLVVSYAWHQLLLGQLDAALAEAPAVVDLILRGVAGYKG
ncbi:TetR/AcrR family transcriptional regulator [Devosia sediminis]|uniref:TetR/AcrR family transcriptional regulator n=1 Tax=Devosia sediminis TaxID=2798801 RepID=A0A934IT02_9HYPH|nr:TetR/AcrR family transcriptional regulator [Devosia sediminis]MBJ3786219.1 TetR/AcrR family transcriptional regulator [Devosia sediminis]